MGKVRGDAVSRSQRNRVKPKPVGMRGSYASLPAQKGVMSSGEAADLTKADAISYPNNAVFAKSLAQQARTIDEHYQPTDEGIVQGPGVPSVVTPLDNTGLPRSWQYRYGWNLPSLPGEGRPLGMDTLRQIASVYDILRKCIEVRKDEFCSLKFNVVARDPDRKRAKDVIKDQQSNIREIEDFFTFPDKKHTWQSWVRMVLEDYFVPDAVSIYKRRTYGGELHSLRVLDGALIKPILDIQGDTPDPPDVAYQQYVWGIARWSFDSDELIYAPKNKRVTSPYGFSPIEQFLTHITLALKHQRWTLDFFTDGTLPEGIAEAPASWSPKQIQEFSQIWDRMLAGDTRALRKLHFVPSGFKFHQFKDWTFDPTFARWLVGVTCAAFDLQPQELGFEPMHSGLGGKGFAEEQSIILKRKALKPLQKWLLDEIINPIIWEEFNAPALVGSFTSGEDVEEKLQLMQARDLAIRNGTMTIAQAAEEDGYEPPDIGRLFIVGQNIYGEPDLLALSKFGAAALPSATGTALPEGRNEPILQKGKAQVELGPGKSVELPQTPQQANQQARQSVAQDTSNAQKTAAQEEKTQGPATQHSTGRLNDPDATNKPNIKKSVEDELDTFRRYAKARQKEGRWRSFHSDILPSEFLDLLNKGAEESMHE